MMQFVVQMVTEITTDPEDQQGAWTVSHPLRPNLQHKEKGQLRSFKEPRAIFGPGVKVSINDDDAIRGPNGHGNHNRSRGSTGRLDGASSLPSESTTQGKGTTQVLQRTACYLLSRCNSFHK